MLIYAVKKSCDIFFEKTLSNIYKIMEFKKNLWKVFTGNCTFRNHTLYIQMLIFLQIENTSYNIREDIYCESQLENKKSCFFPLC